MQRQTATESVQLSVIVPAFNEEARLEATLRRLSRFLRESGVVHEMLVVDDGSTDGTVALARHLCAEMPALRVLESQPNRGKGHAVRLGMLAAEGRVRVMFDADGSMPPEELPRLLSPIAAGRAAVSIGSRYAEGATVGESQPRWRRMWSRLVNRIVRRTLVDGIADTQCGFKAFTAEAAERIFRRARIDGWAFDLEALALARRHGLTIEEVSVTWNDDGRSRVSPLRDFWRVLVEWITIRANLSRGVYGELCG